MDGLLLSAAFLNRKFDEVESRLFKLINQLDEEQLNWRPDENSNSIANLIVHLEGNARQRIAAGIFGEPDTRDRDAEFDPGLVLTKERLIESATASLSLSRKATAELKGDDWLRTQLVRDHEVTALEAVLQYATHYSEHLGQMLYIAKLLLGEQYKTTTIPRKK